MSSSPGVPDSRPVAVLNVAHEGRFWMLKVSALPSGSEALGWKLYSNPITVDSSGVPEIVGGRFACATTWMVKEGSDTVAVPSVSEMVMRAEVPTLAAAGEPESRPVLVLNDAQVG
jgi:hypothetical protein